MASVVNRPNGHKWIQFERKTLRLGKCTVRAAEKHKQIVEAILAARGARLAIEPQVAAFIGALDDVLRERYERCGLIGVSVRAPKKQTGLRVFMDGYFDSLGQTAKRSTREFWGHTRSRLVEYFGADRDLSTITAADARAFHVWLATKGNKRDKPKDENGDPIIVGLAANTVRRRMGLCRQIFKRAIDDGLITQNPFAGMSATVRSNKERQHYIDMETFAQVLEKAPNARWRALLVLARIGALRVPSEVQGLRWSNIAWEAKRMTVKSPKTEHHAGRESRVIPLYPRIETELLKLFAEAEEGAEFVFPDVRPNSNLRTTLQRILTSAGVKQWPKLWQNLRASGATDLARSLPSHVAAAICGHSVEVAQEHYWTVASADLDLAMSVIGRAEDPKQNPKKQAAAETRIASQSTSPSSEIPENRDIPREIEEIEWARRDSNPRHLLCKSSALTN